MSDLDQAKYCSLRTFRRDGRAVETPVWFAGDGARFYVFSAGAAGKVKRIRNSARVEVAPCDVRGKVHGDYVPATANLLSSPDQVAGALRALRRKYGLVMHLFDLGSRLAGRFNSRAYIQFTLA